LRSYFEIKEIAIFHFNKQISKSIAKLPMVKYFLDSNGVPTKRMANVAGGGHYDIAREVLAQDQGNLYAQMFALRYARVTEDDDGTIYVHSPRDLTRKQKAYLDTLRHAKPGQRRSVVLNNKTHMESVDARAKMHKPS
jgi:hypothetical protein